MRPEEYYATIRKCVTCHKTGQITKLTSESGFYDTLLFCCRFDVSGKWLKMIEYYRDERFKNWTDSDVKKMWEVAEGIQKSLNHYF